MNRFSLILLWIVLLQAALVLPVPAEEGMWPLSELGRLDLASKGLRIDPLKVYNPNGISLIDGIINLSGCTASFVSSEGLILTNYHCAFRAVQSVTTPEKDYFREGFMTRERSEEVQAPGYTVRIIDSYRDVSGQVLSVVRKRMTHGQRTRAIEKKIKSILKREEKRHPGKRADVAEMFPGKTYVLFLYTYLRDVRLVYAPPRSIGEFGGEEDNWMWPRHTGDFAFLRAYTAPGGAPADYAVDNVPYHPRMHLQVGAEGVSEGDFVFIPGYPGRTYRHRTSHFLEYEETFRMPWAVETYGWMIRALEDMSARDRSVAIRLSPQLKGLWNVIKNYRGKLKGMRNAGITEQRREQEALLEKYIASSPDLEKRYGGVLDEIGDVFSNLRKNGETRMYLQQIHRGSALLSNAMLLYEAAVERRKPDLKRKTAYMDRNFSRLKPRVLRRYRSLHLPADRALLQGILERLLALPETDYCRPLRQFLGNGKDAVAHFLDTAYAETTLKDRKTAEAFFRAKPEDFENSRDPFIRLMLRLYPVMQKLEEEGKVRKGRLDEQLARLIEVRRLMLGRDFIPDANSTLRLTMGRTRGYSPSDAVTCAPFTTVSGLVEKHTGVSPFVAPARLRQLVSEKRYGRFADSRLKEVPVAMLYDCDTTGGNSGSPVLDAYGRLVGLNFDRVFEATVNDYAWSDRYSRSIGVDIRFILWFLDEYSGADHLLREMKVAGRDLSGEKR